MRISKWKRSPMIRISSDRCGLGWSMNSLLGRVVERQVFAFVGIL
jgi:hypothetical protein